MVLIETVKNYKSSLTDLLNIVRTLKKRLVSNLPISLYNLSYSKNNTHKPQNHLCSMITKPPKEKICLGDQCKFQRSPSISAPPTLFSATTPPPSHLHMSQAPIFTPLPTLPPPPHSRIQAHRCIYNTVFP